MQPKILHIRSDDELTAMRHSLNSYEVYAMFLNEGVLPELTYITVQYTMPHCFLLKKEESLLYLEETDEAGHDKDLADVGVDGTDNYYRVVCCCFLSDR